MELILIIDFMNTTILIHVYINELKEIMTTETTGKLACVLQMTGGSESGLNFSLILWKKETFVICQKI